MGNITKFLIEFVIQLIALAPIWWFIWYIMKRLRKAEKVIMDLVDANNVRAYKDAKRAISTYEAQGALDEAEFKDYTNAKKLVAQFEKDYRPVNPQNN